MVFPNQAGPNLTQVRNPAQRKNIFSQSESPYEGFVDTIRQGVENSGVAGQFGIARQELDNPFPSQETVDKGRAEFPWLVKDVVDRVPLVNQAVNMLAPNSPSGPTGQNTPTEMRAGGGNDQQYANALKQADTISALYNMLNLADEAGLSDDPAYASEIERIKNAANSSLTEIQRQIALLQGGGELLAQQSGLGRQRVEELMAQFKPQGADIAGALAPARQAVEASLDNALAPSAEVQLAADETYGKSGGGATTQAMADKAADKRNEGVREIEAAVTGTLDNFEKLGNKIDKAAQAVASSQIELYGLQDAGMRERARLEMEMKIRNNTWDLVEQRKGILAAQDDAIATLAAEREARAAGNVVMTLPYDAITQAATVADNFFLSSIRNSGLSLSPQEKNLLEALVEEMTLAVPSAREDVWLQMLTDNPNLRALPGEKQAKFGQIIKDTASTYDRAYGEWEASELDSVKKFNSGTPEMAQLIYNAGTTGPNALPESYVAQLAQSGAFHKIIEIQSGGNAKYKGNGSLSGLGGLPRSIYHAANVDPDTATPTEQMQVLILYIAGAYGGDPVAALENFLNNEEFVKPPAPDAPTPEKALQGALNTSSSGFGD